MYKGLFGLFKRLKRRYNNCVIVPYSLKHHSALEEDYKHSQYSRIYENEAMVSKTDVNGIITFANDKFLLNTGYSRDEVIGKTHAIIKSPTTEDSVFVNLWCTIKAGKRWSGFMEGLRKNGTPFYSKVKIYPIFNSRGHVVEFLAFRNDITDVIDMKKAIEKTQKEIILAMGSIGENRSGETGHHVNRVAEYSYTIALAYGIPPKDADIIRMAAPMHDIGKVAIADSILNKPSRLTEEEFEIMKSHSRLGYDMFKDSPLELCRIAGEIAHEHHEKWDGTGYPRGIRGEDIHIHARIVTICDVYDALRSDRCYKRGWTHDEVMDYFIKESGKQFDPILVDLFIENLDRIKEIEEEFKD